MAAANRRVDTSRDAEFSREYRAEPAYAKSMTRDQYIEMRRVDVGLATLRVGSQAPTQSTGTPSLNSAPRMPPGDNSRDLEFAREYRDEPAYARRMTQAEYIEMRRVDVGLATLQIGSKAPAQAASAAVADYRVGSNTFLS